MTKFSFVLLIITLVTGALGKCCSNDRQCSKPIKITNNQVSVLRTAADVLNKRTSSVKFELAKLETKGPFDEAKSFLRSSVYESRKDLWSTRSAFEKYSKSARQREASNIFFGDLAIQYSQVDEILITVEKDEYQEIRERAFRLFEYNFLAYKAVAASQSLTFNLAVTSAPRKEASVYFRRKGEDYQKYSNNTDTTIPNLIYAVWYVRVELPGYESEEKQHDPYREPNHALYFDLKPN
jgi:hypothetical protein